ncbi:unnamed protein product [Paramecium sonneborni]|uniref:Transmembrane protein n=1 Tax=Paramecium sonneborni TaxID=65129 RepID=A0A8S1QWV4_9CILI|nr:unnamed protein product [Paramecium sonneborni]
MHINSELHTDRPLIPPIKKSDSLRSQSQFRSCPAYFKTLQLQKIQNIKQNPGIEQQSKVNPLNIFVKIIRFITIITQSIFPQDFKYLDANMFRIINDKAADFKFYVKNDYFKYIKAAPDSQFQRLVQKTIFQDYTLQNLFDYLSKSQFLFKPEQNIILIWNIYLVFMTNFNFLYCTIKFAFDFENQRPDNYKEGEIFFLIIPFQAI